MIALTEYADAFLIEIALMKVISFCFIIKKEVESPGFVGYLPPRHLNVLSDLTGMRCGIQPAPWFRISGGSVVGRMSLRS